MASENTSLNVPVHDQSAHSAPPSHGPPGYNTFSYYQPGHPGPSYVHAGQDSTPPLFPEDMEPYVGAMSSLFCAYHFRTLAMFLLK